MENNIDTTPTPRHEPIFSKVGFWLSLSTFVIWMLALLCAILSNFNDAAEAIFILAVMICLTLGICGLIFSITGLVIASHKDLPKAFALWGIALLAGCLVIPFLAAIIFTIFR